MIIKNLYYITLVVLSCLMLGCTRSSSLQSDAEWQQVKQRLATLDDSIQKQTDGVMAFINSGMTHAADSMEYYAYLLRKANYYYLTATPDSMLPYIQQTLDYCNRTEPNPRLLSIKAQALENRAVYSQLFRYPMDSVIRIHLQALEALKEGDTPELMPKLCSNLADAYCLNNQQAEAAMWYRKAIFQADSMQMDPVFRATLTMGLAHIYQNLHEYEQANQHFMEAGRWLDEMPINMKIYYLNNRGTYYYEVKDYEKAEEQFLLMQQLLENNGRSNSFDMLLCKINLADVSLNLGKTALAKHLIDEVEPQFEACGVTDGVHYAHSIRIALAATGDDDTDIQGMLAAEQFTKPSEQSIIDIRNRYLRRYYLSVNNYAEAYHNLKAEVDRNDSLQLERQHMQATDMMMRMQQDTLRLHQQLDLIKQKSAMRSARMWVVILVALVLVILLLTAYLINRNRKRQLQDELRIMQLRLQGVRQRISPHFILNVMSREKDKSGAINEQEMETLTRLIRANLEISHQPLISLRDELDFVSNYMKVECGDEVAYQVCLPEHMDVDNTLIPSMFIQILAENAVKHGLKGLDGEKRLDVTVTDEGARWRIAVENSGRPFDIRATRGHSTGIGLAAIRETVAIYNERHPYDVQMDFSVSKRPDGTGCRSVLNLPKEMKSIV